MPRVGIVGGGQLARMMCQAAIPLGVDIVVLAANDRDSAAQVAHEVVVGSPDDLDALRQLARRVDVVTFDHELVDPHHLHALQEAGHILRPGPGTLEVAVNKLRQRRLFSSDGLPVPGWSEAASAQDVAAFAGEHGWPVVVKLAHGGYDGRGVWICRSAADVTEISGLGEREFLVEELVDIDRELAVQVARRPGGEEAVYEVVDSLQVEGICREVTAPSVLPPAARAEAQRVAGRIADLVGATGNLAIELFLDRSGRVLINEIAARPHNSGHYTIEGAETSQFENHLRGVLDWPLGSTALRAPAAVMVNVLGSERAAHMARALPEVLRDRGAHVHWYGKESRPGRKLGHVTVLAESNDEALARARAAARRLAGEGEA